MKVEVMQLFVSLASLGLGFMLYALVQFFRDTGRRSPARTRDSSLKIGRPHLGTLVRMNLTRSVGKQSSSQTQSAEWSHGNGEIQVRTTYSDGRVIPRRICASARRTVGVSGRSESASKAS